MTDLRPGQIVWVDVDAAVGREQGGRRPHVVLSCEDYLDLVDALFIAAPLTTTNREWPNRVRAVGETGLKGESWIMTEQVRTLSRQRIFATAGQVSPLCLMRARDWIREFLALGS
ncbi:MAG: type II toxin-antitoxin system PemK/MazF family toxin [Actinobacteria bacterium]|nr:type II toxin-antitoxin system PemK/MazF family toxin [Actinomycetota bacterium]